MTKSLKINDPVLFVLTLLATVLGLIFIFDAGYPRSIQAEYGAIPKEFKSQIIFLPVAIIAAIVVGCIRGDKWQKVSKYVWWVSFMSLILPFLPVIGVDHNGASRWIKIGPAELQPAEFAKVAVILFLAGVFANRAVWPKKIRAARHAADYLDRIVLPKLKRCMPGIFVLLAVLVIEKEPDMGTAFVVAVTAFIMFIVGGTSRKTLIVGAALAIFGVVFLTMQEPYRLERIENHSNRWSGKNIDDTGYQTVQSELAMAMGGLIGVGPGAGRAKHVLPAATTDFILATVGEEFGIIGVVIVLGVLGCLVFRLFMLAQRAPTHFGALILSGVGAWIGIQTCVNVMMANGLLPAIGIPLPLVSSGGSSLVALWVAMGLCQAVLTPVPEKEEKRATSRNRWRHRRPRLSRA